MGFGDFFTDHMAVVDFDSNKKWFNPRIEIFRDINIKPSASVFHYCHSVYEGIKAYRNNDEIFIFRIKSHLKRLIESAKKLCIPEIGIDLLEELIIELVKLDRSFIPQYTSGSLYIRPVIFSSDESLGLKEGTRYRCYIMMSRIEESFFNQEFSSLMINNNLDRVPFRGTGCIKAGANYASSLIAIKEAKKFNADHVLWLDPIEKKNIEEFSTMNFFYKEGDRLVTPKLTDSILKGITRDSVITISRNIYNLDIREEEIDIRCFLENVSINDKIEVFGTGTALNIYPFKRMVFNTKEYLCNNQYEKSFVSRLQKDLLDIKIGRNPLYTKWLTPVE